jgi:hypothetical protein
MKVEDSEPQYGRRVFLRVFQDLVRKKRAKFTILGASISTGRKDLRPHWKGALKSALRTNRNRTGIEYALLFEHSPKGREHAHIILTKRTGKKSFSRVNWSDIEPLRDIYFKKLHKRVGKNLEESNIAKALDFDPKRMLKVVKVFRPPTKPESLKPAGQGPGFLNYLLEKRELIEQGTTISYGLIKLRKNG